MAEIYQLPDNNGGNNNGGFGNIPFSIPIGGMGGGLFGGNGFGNDIGGLIALAIVASIFGWNGGNGFGGFGALVQFLYLFPSTSLLSRL